MTMQISTTEKATIHGSQYQLSLYYLSPRRTVPLAHSTLFSLLKTLFPKKGWRNRIFFYNLFLDSSRTNIRILVVGIEGEGGGIYIYRSGGRCDFGSHTLEWRWRAEFQMRGTRLHNWPPVVFCVSCFSPEKRKKKLAPRRHFKKRGRIEINWRLRLGSTKSAGCGGSLIKE